MENKTNSPEKKITKWETAKELIKFVLIALLIVLPIRILIAKPFVVSGGSMIPTFQDKQYLIVDELSYNLGKINRGDVVIFKFPGNPKKFFIKRIIGLPNEKVEIINGVVKIINKENPDGFILDEPYIKEPFTTSNIYNVPNDNYFVLGDNRNGSADSRAWGFVPHKYLVGRAYLRLFPFSTISYLPGEHKY
jgi:signal peptidase I